MSVIEVVKQHPYIVGGGAIGVVVLVFMFSGSSTTAGTSVTAAPSPGVDAASAAANASVATAQLSAGVRNNELLASLEAARIASDTSVRLKEIDSANQLQEDALSATIAHESLLLQGKIAAGQQDLQRDIQLGQQETQRYIFGVQSTERQHELDTIRDMNISHDAAVAKQSSENTAALVKVQELNALTAVHTIDAQTTVALSSHDVMVHQIDTNAALMAQAANEAAARDGQNQIWRNNAAIVAAAGNQAGAQWFLSQIR